MNHDSTYCTFCLWYLLRFSVDNSGSILPAPTGPPPKVPPTIQEPIAAVPAKSSSHRISKENNGSKGMAPSTGNHASHLRIGAGNGFTDCWGTFSCLRPFISFLI